MHYQRLAEWLILETILFEQFDNISVKSFSSSIGTSGRLDAEYYQPKFDTLFNQLNKQPVKSLGDLVHLKKSIEPGSSAYQTEGVPFVRVSDLSKFGIGQTDKFLDRQAFPDVVRPKKETILLSKDGTVGIAYCVPEDMDVITSGAIVHLEVKSDEVLPDYLALVLNSLVVQLQAERDSGGSIIQHWKPSEILKVVVPILPKAIQERIAKKIKESFSLRKKSEDLLARAKLLVESEIERMGHDGQ